MTTRPTNFPAMRADRGFSMIDVLVAIVVLATGLLALAALQGALTRNGADSRARSQVAAYTESVIDRMRFAGYDAVVPGTITNNQSITPATTCTAGATALTLVNRLKSDAKCAQTAAGVSNLTTLITGSQYWGSGGTFTTAVPTNTAGVPNYKQINVTTTWTDATGQARTLSFDTTVSGVTVSPTDGSLDQKTFGLTTGGSPVVREANPGNTAGVIPIAVSSTQNAAATNPAPVVTNTGTTFSTLTYNATASSLGGNIISQRIDTKVIRCSCKFGGPVSADTLLTTILTQPYQPTYWDGTQYVTATKTSSGTSTTGIDTAATQDSDCDICCRDRNDVAGNTVLFDNNSNPQNFSKYQYVTTAGVTALAVVTTGTFVQACRMIRVGGTYATATDIRDYFFGILDTESCSTAGTANSPTGCTSSNDESSAVPSATAETGYQNFVKDYMFNSYTSLKAGTGPYVVSTDPLDTDAAATLYNTTYSLNTPTSIILAKTNDTRYLHARGLFIDHLESKAVTALKNAIASCSSQTDEPTVNNCALPVLPFTTVNLTELAFWSASAASVIATPSNAAVGGIGSSPARGYASSASSTTNGTVYSIATVNQLNSGLTGITSQSAVSFYDSTYNLLDHKQFVVGTGSSGGGGGGPGSVYFDVVLSGLSWMNIQANVSLDPSVAWSATPAQLGGTGVASTNTVSLQTGSSPSFVVTYAGGSATVVTPTGCTKKCGTATTYTPNVATPTSPVAAPVGVTVTVQGFNTCAGKKFASDGVTVVSCPTATGAGTETVTCSAISGGVTASHPSTTATQCTSYTVDTANIKIGSTTAPGSSSLLSGTTVKGQLEGAVITIPNAPGITSTTNTTAGADLITIPFINPVTTVVAGTCVCTSKTCASNKQTYTVGTCAK